MGSHAPRTATYSHGVAGIRLEEITISYGDVVAVDGLSLEVPPGHVLGVLGSNGAGKSSTLRAIGGVNAHSSGRLLVAGHDVATPAGAEAARHVTGYCPDIGGLLAQATPTEHIALVAALRARPDLTAYGQVLLERLGLADVADRPAGTFSHGMGRRLSVLLALLGATEVLVLDEPFDGVDPTGVEVTIAAIRNAAAQGLAVVVSTHLQDLLVEACDEIAVILGGRLAAVGPAQEFAGSEGKERYAALLAIPRAGR